MSPRSPKTPARSPGNPRQPGNRGRKGRTLTVGGIFMALVVAAFLYITGGLPEASTPVPEGSVTTSLPVSSTTPGSTSTAVPSPARSGSRKTPPGGSGKGWQVMFTDPAAMPAPADPAMTVPAGSIEAALIARITKAKRSVHLACFETDLDPIAKALVEAKGRGLDVRWITDNEFGLESDTEKGHGQFAMLTAKGVPIKSDERSALMHDKFIVIDGSVVWTGATNLTVAGMFENNNNAIVLESPALAAIYEREFEEMWGGAFGPKSPSAPDAQKVQLGDIAIQALFSPEDGAMSVIVPLVANARSSIRIMAFSFTHEDLGKAVAARAASGVDTAVIFETRGSETVHSELGMFLDKGIPSRQDGNGSSFHHKVIVIDGRWTVTGSLNFSANADESNSENTLIIDSPAIAALYLEEFERRWAEAKKPDFQAKAMPKKPSAVQGG